MTPRIPYIRRSRAVSEVVGFILLFALVIIAAGMLLLVGGMAKDQVEQQQRIAAAEDWMQGADSDLGTLARADGPRSTVVRFGERDGDMDIGRSGAVTITVNELEGCSATVNLSAIRYRDEAGGTVAYEAGAVWKDTSSGQVMVSPPELSYRNGSIHFALLNVSGDVGADENEFRAVRTGQGSETSTRIRRQLFGGQDCRIPRNVSISVRSDYYRAWTQYLRQEFHNAGVASTVAVDSANETVRVDMTIDPDPPTVINFSGDGADAHDGNDTIVVGQPHSPSIDLLGLYAGQEGTRTRKVVRQPLEVTVVYDRSGSMDFEADGDDREDWCHEGGPWGAEYDRFGNLISYESGDRRRGCSESKRAVAVRATQGFVGGLNRSEDEVAVVQFNTNSYTEQDLTGNFWAVNRSIASFDAKGGTTIEAGLEAGIDQYRRNDPDKDNAVVLLSDGKNDNGDNTAVIAAARRAARLNVSVYVVGFGSANETLLRRVTAITNGTYYDAGTVDDVGEKLQEIKDEIVERRAYKRLYYDPLVVNMSVGGTPYTLLANGSIVDGTVTTTEASLNPIRSGDVSPPIPARPARDDVNFTGQVAPGAEVRLSATQFACSTLNVTDDPIYVNGTYYNRTTCDDLGPPLETSADDTSELHTLTHGDTVPVGTGAPDWALSTRDLLVAEGLYNASTATVSMKRDRVLLVYNLSVPDGYVTAVLLYDAGRAPSEVDYSHRVTITVTDVQVSEADEE